MMRSFQFSTVAMKSGFLLCVLLPLLTSGCGPAFLYPEPTETSTPTPPPPTATPAPSWTPLPATATFTPVPTRTPVPDSWTADSAPTPTWTPVPGNPRWSWWSYEGVAFLLPVAWQKAAHDPPAGRQFRASGGSEQPQLLVEVERVQEDMTPSFYADSKLQAARLALSEFEMLASAPFDVDGTPLAQRVVYTSVLPDDAGVERKTRGIAFYLVEDGWAVSLRFWVADRLFEEWVNTFDQIAASLELPKR